MFSYLKGLGYEPVFRFMLGPEMVKARRRLAKDEMLFVWSGAYRNATADRWRISPEIMFSDRAFIPFARSIYCDPQGGAATSSLVDKGTFPPLTSEQRLELDDYLQRRYLAREPVSMDLPDRFWFLPLQLRGDGNLIYDAPEYVREPLALIKAICKVLPSGIKLVVKQHPSSKGGIALPRNMPVHLVEKHSNAINQTILRAAEGMVAINSSFIYQALVFDLPVITLGRGVFSGNLVTKEVETVDKDLFDSPVCDPVRNDRFLYELLCRRQVHQDDLADNPAIIKRFWAGVEDRYCEFWRERGRHV